MIDKTVNLLFAQCSCGKCCTTTPVHYYLNIAIRKGYLPIVICMFSYIPEQNMGQSKEIQ